MTKRVAFAQKGASVRDHMIGLREAIQWRLDRAITEGHALDNIISLHRNMATAEAYREIIALISDSYSMEEDA